MSAVSIPVSVLNDIFDVVNNPPWSNVNKPVDRNDVLEAVRQKNWTSRHMIPLYPEDKNQGTTELDHARRIAWMVMHPPQDPVIIDTSAIDVLMDGNHRLYAAIIRGDEMIDAFISGFEDDIVEIFGTDIRDQVFKSDEPEI